ncbi:hypothetical protein FOZ62_015508, partial [Perkinsus olseni]
MSSSLSSPATPLARSRASSLMEAAMSSADAAKELYAFVMSGEIRDETFDEKFYESLRNLMSQLLSTTEPSRYLDLVPARYCRASVVAILDLPEFDYGSLAQQLDNRVLLPLVKRCGGAESTESRECMLVAT